MRDIEYLKRQAAGHGEQIGVYAARLLDDPLPWTRMRKVYRLLGARLWAEVREQGYDGCRRSVRRYLNTLGDGPNRRPRAPEFAARQVCQWILRRPDRLDDDDRERLRAICGRCSTLATATQLVQRFARLLRERRGQNQLVAWIEAVEDADIPELRTFASGLRNDWAAVTAGLTLPWSSGRVDGHVNRIKMLKRQMYGRANLDLLRRRVLAG
jgi:transposase